MPNTRQKKKQMPDVTTLKIHKNEKKKKMTENPIKNKTCVSTKKQKKALYKNASKMHTKTFFLLCSALCKHKSFLKNYIFELISTHLLHCLSGF